MAIEGDSGEYEYLTEGIALSSGVEGICMEIGTRRGLSLKYIIDAVRQYCPNKTVISVDPFGGIPYIGREHDGYTKLDYTNQMKHECMRDIYTYLCDNPCYFQFYNMTDGMFFSHFFAGVPTYKNEEEDLEGAISFAFLDGPHHISGIENELIFIMPRMRSGSVIVYDDITPDFYDHDAIRTNWSDGWEIVRSGLKKEIWQKL